LQHAHRSDHTRRYPQAATRGSRSRLRHLLGSLPALILALVIVGTASATPAELGMEFEVGNLGFAHDRAPGDDGIPDDEFQLGGRFWGSYNPTDFLTVELIADRDQVLQNSITSRLKYRGDRVRFALGPSFGVINEPDQVVAPGLSAEASVDVLPRLNIALATLRPLQPDLDSDGEYRQRFDRAAISSYGDNLIVTLLFEQSRMREQDDGVTRTNRLRRYAMQAEAFEKGAPFRILVSGEYHDRSFIFENDDDATQTYGALVLGTGVSYEPTPRFGYSVLLESGLYNFGRNDLLGEFEEDAYLFRLRTGFTVSLD